MPPTLSIARTVITTTPALIQVVKGIREWKRKRRIKEEYINDLFGFIGDADFSTGNIPPDDVDSLKLFKGWFQQHFRRDRSIEEHVQLPRPNINKHLCSIGGPVDLPLTRYGMGYDNRGENWLGVLPFYFDLKGTESSGVTIRRVYKGIQWETLNWRITDRDGNLRFVPGTDKDGILNKDYLMLIIAPNTFTDQAIYTSQKHMMMAGAHGLAQLAIKDLFDNDEFLEKLIEVRGRHEYFQAIIEIHGVRSKEGYIPALKSRETIPPMVVQPLDLSEFTKKLKRYKEWS